LNILPTIEEEKLLKEYNGEPNELALPERYLSKIIQVPRLPERVKFLEYISKFPSCVSIIKEDIRLLQCAVSYFKSSKIIKLILIICLGVSNYLNNANHNGFAVDSLNIVKILNIKPVCELHHKR